MIARLISVAALTALAMVGCGDDDGGGPVDAGDRDTGPAPDAGPMDEDAGPMEMDAGPLTTIRTVVDLDEAMFEFPEGVALSSTGDAYVGLAASGVVLRVTSDGMRSNFGNVPAPGGMDGFMTGLAVDDAGNVYAAVARVNPAAATLVPGIYRIPAAGGMGVLWASGAPMTMQFANDLDFDAAGNLYVTDSSGSIFKIPPAGAIGTAAVWSTDASLAPAAMATGPCGMRPTPFGIGANGLVVEADRVIVANTEMASITAIAINGDGTAGAATMIAMDCATLGGIDGLARVADGDWLAVMQGTFGFARVTEDGTVTVLHMGAPLRGPASVDYGMFGTATEAVITNSSFGDVFAGSPETGMPAVLAATLL